MRPYEEMQATFNACHPDLNRVAIMPSEAERDAACEKKAALEEREQRELVAAERCCTEVGDELKGFRWEGVTRVPICRTPRVWDPAREALGAGMESPTGRSVANAASSCFALETGWWLAAEAGVFVAWFAATGAGVWRRSRIGLAVASALAVAEALIAIVNVVVVGPTVPDILGWSSLASTMSRCGRDGFSTLPLLIGLVLCAISLPLTLGMLMFRARTTKVS